MYNIKEEEFKWLNEYSMTFLKRDYLLPGQSFADRLTIILDTFKKYQSEEIVLRFLEYFKRGYYSFSTPVWTNYGTKRGLPISCFGTYIGDTMEQIVYSFAEISMMSKYGGGTSAFFDLRPRGATIKDNGSSGGAYEFQKIYDVGSRVISQGATRRGAFAAYIDADNPDVLEHLTIKTPGNDIQNINIGVTVSDSFMHRLIAKDKWALKVQAKIIEHRKATGFPYIIFTDNANNNTVDVYKDKSMKIYASNLCTEIMLPSSEKESFVCCLSSMNLLYYDEWKDTDAVELLTYFLDSVMEEFIQRLKEIKNEILARVDNDASLNVSFMERALYFAEKHRALGLGALGYHDYLQSKMIPFESFEARQLNALMFKFIKERSYKASAELAIQFGEPELLKGYGRRNTTLNAVAPTKSSGFILEQSSEGIEPHEYNIFTKDGAKVSITFKNRWLKQLLALKGKDTIEIWDSISKNRGSVSHLDFLSDHEKDVFKTTQEISPKELVIQAAGRQKHIDQGQSLNLFILPKTPTKIINQLMIEAWQLGIKSLYYQKNVNSAQEFATDFMNECAVCQ